MSSLQNITFAGLLISISLILSKMEFSFAFGGSITLFSMVPIIIISLRYGHKFGALSGLIFGIMHLITTNIKFQGLNILSIFISIFLDYIIGYYIIGLISFFYVKINNLTISIIFVFFFKFIINVLSGVLVWSSFSNSFYLSLIYSITYNASYNIPETLINISGILIIKKYIPQLILFRKDI